MNRDYHYHDDHVSFIQWREYMNHSRPQYHERSKGAFYTRSKVLQWLVGFVFWKWLGIGGRN